MEGMFLQRASSELDSFSLWRVDLLGGFLFLVLSVLFAFLDAVSTRAEKKQIAVHTGRLSPKPTKKPNQHCPMDRAAVVTDKRSFF